MQRKAIQWVAVIALLGAAGVWCYFQADPYRNSYGVRELATWGLGSHLAKTFPGQRVLVFSNPFTQREGTAHEIVATEQAGLRGLNRGPHLFFGRVFFSVTQVGSNIPAEQYSLLWNIADLGS